jgi:hypothetical protein
MSFSEYENCFVWSCESCDATVEFKRIDQPGYFMSCVGELKARGWRIWRDREGEWGEWCHKCPKCRNGEAKKILDMKFPGPKRSAG